jgi:protein-S-isoprenylcysteine O-methyltransferase Ste14
MKKQTLPPTYFLMALVAMVLLHYLWPIHRYWEFPLTLIGVAPLALGIALNVVADREFKRHQTTVKPFEQSSALITAFPFSISRNPMYLGITLMLVGIAVLFGSVSTLLPAAAFAILMDRRFVELEERMLAERFGNEWSAYRASVRRWL